MKNQLLDRAGGAVLRSPGFEFILMGQQQFGQVAGILAVVLGAAGDEGLAESLKADRIDGKESDPFISFEEINEVGGGLFEAQSDSGQRMVLAQFPEPFQEG